MSSKHIRGDVNYAWPIDEYQKRFANPFVAAERGYIDEVIKPHTTRKRICRALRMLRTKELKNPWKKHDNIPL